ncbi:hypothetical protein [Nesterenkonia ebinurensis]|uniref:hypothetical protein n=1 Tax=Nesterenkonia ebinurensis TaxID=2608252 RepID=UPI00123C90ED|nr:hypothetical protein [Nesterenkonia ebinurensis]
METHGTQAQESLEAVAKMREHNQRRLIRPRRYWVMLSGMMALLSLLPYMDEWPFYLSAAVIIAVALVLVLAASWKQPSASRKTRFNFRAIPVFLVLVLGIAVLVMGSRYAYTGLDWWWAPALSAVLIFGFVNWAGPVMDRAWVRGASSV